jgi:hypothetical protein
MSRGWGSRRQSVKAFGDVRSTNKISVPTTTYSFHREVIQQARGDGHVGLDHGSGGKGPTRTAVALVLDGGHDVLVTPVDGMRQSSYGLHDEVLGQLLLVLGSMVLSSALVSALECLHHTKLLGNEWPHTVYVPPSKIKCS